MIIKVYNDKKEKSQSFEASFESKCLGEPFGYGENEKEALQNIKKDIELKIAYLKKAIKEIENKLC